MTREIAYLHKNPHKDWRIMFERAVDAIIRLHVNELNLLNSRGKYINQPVSHLSLVIKTAV